MLALPLLTVIAAAPSQQTDTLDLLWPSPILKVIDPTAQANNKALFKLLNDLSHSQPSVKKTNIGGWQSNIDLFERTESEILLLRTRTYHAVFRYLQAMAPPGSEGKFEVSIGSAWANLNNRTHGNSPHLHPGSQISGVYYVDDGGSRLDGVRLVDPRPQASMVPTPAKWTFGMGEHVRVQAVPGLFVLFPSWLQHYVVAHEGSGTRTSISFNVRITYPEESDDAGFIGSSGGSEKQKAAPKLSFHVPPHHEKSFLDKKLSGDMRVSR